MQYGVFGTGIVGQTLSTKLIQVGHDVKIGSRDANNSKAKAWADANGGRASSGNFADTASFGQIIINATPGSAALEVIEAAGANNIGSKIVIDVSNPLDMSNGFPPSLTVCNTDSVGEQIQKALPAARVVKSLNTMTAAIMTSPGALHERHNVFINGDDSTAKAEVRAVLNQLGWPDEDIVDLGDITASRAAEAYVLLWTRMFGAFANPGFNIRVVKA